MTKHVCLRKNHQLLLIKALWICFKYNDLLHKLNIYKIPAKEDQVLDLWVTDEISRSEMLKYLEYVSLNIR